MSENAVVYIAKAVREKVYMDSGDNMYVEALSNLVNLLCEEIERLESLGEHYRYAECDLRKEIEALEREVIRLGGNTYIARLAMAE